MRRIDPAMVEGLFDAMGDALDAVAERGATQPFMEAKERYRALWPKEPRPQDLVHEVYIGTATAPPSDSPPEGDNPPVT